MPPALTVRTCFWRPAPLALLAVAALLASGALTTPASAGDVNLNFYPLSARSLDEDLWAPVEDQWAFGGTVDFGEKGSPLHMALGLHMGIGADDFDTVQADDVVSVVTELSVGIAGAWQSKGALRGYVAGGFSFVGANFEVDTILGDVDDDDDSLGGWIEAGMAWRLGSHFSLGFGGRALVGTDIELFGIEGDADYFQFGPLLGWSWPARSR